MKVVVIKDSKESNERVISRFNKVVQGSRKLNKVREEKFYVHKPTKRLVRAKAVKREGYREQRAKTRFH